MSNLEERASMYALAAHTAAGNIRKYTGEPYIVHPCRVVALLRKHYAATELQKRPAIIAATWLHDVVEDTHCTIDNIRHVFGQDVASIVAGLTDDKTPETREERKALACINLRQQEPIVQTIKCCDIIDNCNGMRIEDPEFFKQYSREKRELLLHLDKANPILWNLAMEASL